MPLPVKFKNVHYYRIAGKYIFAGDLFVTRGALYYFPEIDLEQQRNKATGHLPHEVATLAVAAIYFAQSFGTPYSCELIFGVKQSAMTCFRPEPWNTFIGSKPNERPLLLQRHCQSLHASS